MNMASIKNFFSKHFVEHELTPQQKVQEAQGKVNGILAYFQEANDELDNANMILEEAKVENKKEIESLKAKLKNVENEVVQIDDEVSANNGLKQEVGRFIK